MFEYLKIDSCNKYLISVKEYESKIIEMTHQLLLGFMNREFDANPVITRGIPIVREFRGESTKVECIYNSIINIEDLNSVLNDRELDFKIFGVSRFCEDTNCTKNF